MTAIHRRIATSGFLALLLATPVVADESPAHIDVFTESPADIRSTAQLERQGITVTVYDTGALTRIEARLSEGLPPDEPAAMSMVRDRLNAIGEAQIAPLRAAHLARHHSQRLGLVRTPAVVFDELTILYDVTDLALALQQWQETQQ